NSMLSKLGEPTHSELKIEAKQEKELVSILMNFNQAVEQATTNYRPSVLTAYIYELARAYNSFYAECPVGPASEPVRSSRMLLSNAVSKTLKTGSELLGFKARERM